MCLEVKEKHPIIQQKQCETKALSPFIAGYEIGIVLLYSLDVCIGFEVETPNGQMVWCYTTSILHIIYIYTHMTYHIQGPLQPIVAESNHTVTINHPTPFAQQRLSSASSTCSSTE